MSPATLSIIVATFPPKQRGQAIGIWAGVSALALAIGPLAGGLITEHLNWNWIFFINVPGRSARDRRLAVRDSRVARHLARTEHRRARPPHLERGFLFSLSYALVEGNRHGWTSPEILGLFAASADSARSIRRRSSTGSGCRCSTCRCSGSAPSPAANLVAMLVSLGMFGVFFFVSLYIQNILGITADEGRREFLPMTILIILIAPIAGPPLRSGRVSLVDGRRDDAGRHLAAALPAHRRRLRLLDAAAVVARRRRRDGDGDVADDLCGDGLRFPSTRRAWAPASSTASARSAARSGSPSWERSSPRRSTIRRQSAAGAQDFVNGLHHGFEVAAAITFAGAVVAIVLVRTRPAVVREHIAELAA